MCLADGRAANRQQSRDAAHTHTWQMLLPTARLPSHFAARTTAAVAVRHPLPQLFAHLAPTTPEHPLQLSCLHYSLLLSSCRS